MKISKLFLATMVLISLACLATVQGQYSAAYSSSASLPSPTSSAISQYGQYSSTPAVSQANGYLVGTVLSVRDEGSMYVNFTRSNIPGMEGTTLILLPHPVPNLRYFQGKELSFSLLGHDIMGRPVCDAYFDGMPIEDYLTIYEKYGNYVPEFDYYPLWHGYYAPGYGFYPMWHGYYTSRYPLWGGYYMPWYGYYSSESLQISESA